MRKLTYRELEKRVIELEKAEAELNKTEIKLREKEERLSGILRSIPGAILITFPDDGKIMEVNEALSLMSGYKKSEAVGKTAAELNLWIGSPEDQ